MKEKRLRKLAADHGLSREKLLEKLGSGDLVIADEGRAFETEAARAARREVKLTKWAQRLAPFDVDYRALDKSARKDARARWRADRALARLAKALGRSQRADVSTVGDGLVRRDGKFFRTLDGRLVKASSSLETADGLRKAQEAADAREPSDIHGSRPRIDYEAHAARVRRSL
jgi:hypothetical protein